MVVSTFNFPTIYRAFLEIQYDNGGDIHSDYAVPDTLIRVLPTIERTLANLPLADLLTLCVGEHCEQEKVTALHKDIEFASEILSEFFSEWHDWS